MNGGDNPFDGPSMAGQQNAAMNQLGGLGSGPVTRPNKAEGLASAIDNVDSLQRNLQRLISEIQGEDSQKCPPEAERPQVSLQSVLNNGENTLREKIDGTHKLIEVLREMLL